MAGNGGKRPGAGRPRGTKNKSTAEVRELVLPHTPEAITELVRLATKAENEATRVAAIKELLDRGYGKSTQAHEHSGPGGGPIVGQWLPSV